MQICCSQSSFATSDPTCQQNSLNFVFFNNSQCGNSCAPPSSSDYIPSTGKVVPQTGWQPGATVNICVDPGFGTTDSQALANGAAAGLAAAGQKTTITYNLTASVCTGNNSYQIVDNALGTSPDDAETQNHIAWTSGASTAVYTTSSVTTVFMSTVGASAPACGLSYIGAHEAMHSAGLADDYNSTGGCSSTTYMWYAVPGCSGGASPAVGAADQCALKQTSGRANGSGGSGGASGGGCSPNCATCCGTTCMSAFKCPYGYNQPYCAGSLVQCTCTISCGTFCLSALTCESTGQMPQCEDEDEGWIPVCPDSPIVVDAFGEGFHLTNVAGGVRFRLLPDDSLRRMSWTDDKWRNGWLALDRNGDGALTTSPSCLAT